MNAPKQSSSRTYSRLISSTMSDLINFLEQSMALVDCRRRNHFRKRKQKQRRKRPSITEIRLTDARYKIK